MPKSSFLVQFSEFNEFKVQLEENFRCEDFLKYNLLSPISTGVISLFFNSSIDHIYLGSDHKTKSTANYKIYCISLNRMSPSQT